MNKPFYIDLINGLRIDYETLIIDLNQTKSFSKYCLERDYYSIFKNLLVSLLIDEPIYLFDPDTSTDEISLITSEKDKIENSSMEVSINRIPDIITLRNFIEKVQKWRLFLCTSGTTGNPKMISHDYKTITRIVKISAKHSDSIWGFAYNPTHIAGVQIFFQAILNFNSIVRLFGLQKELIIKSIIEEKITHISATPTFYRLLLPINEKINHVKRITSGGEKLDLQTTSKLKEIFTEATFRNVYASTEAGSVFTSENEYFTIDSDTIKLVKILGNELFLRSELIGETNTSLLNDDWYATGDLVEIISNDPIKFRFISRRSEIINVGGYNVNPHEVEEAIRSIKNIDKVIVYSRKNSVTDNIVCADIVCKDIDLTVPVINSLLRAKLPEYKIPRMINFVDNISLTRTGKQARK